MRIGIIGVGAIGGVLAARLLASRRDGEQIALAAGRSTPAIREKGLRIEGEASVPASEVSERLDGSSCDVLFLCSARTTSSPRSGRRRGFWPRTRRSCACRTGFPRSAPPGWSERTAFSAP
jgi:hypothetical protein